MTVASFCDDMLILAVFMLVGFFVREIAKPLQKLFLSSSLIGGLVLLILGPQIAGVVNVPESFSSMPSVMIDIVMATTVFGVTINRKKMGSYLDYSCMTMTSYGMQMALAFFWDSCFRRSGRDFRTDGASWAYLPSTAATVRRQRQQPPLTSWAFREICP